MKLIIPLLCLLGLISSSSYGQAGSGDVEAKVEFILSAVAKSDMTFIRNGDPHTGKEAAEHMRAKYDHFKKDIKTPEDFIRLAGTKSLVSGKPYQVRSKEGKVMASDEWLRGILATYGSSSPPAK